MWCRINPIPGWKIYLVTGKNQIAGAIRRFFAGPCCHALDIATLPR